MRNLNESNHALGSSRFAFLVSLIIPFFTGLLCYGLAIGSAPNIPLSHNFLAMGALGISLLAAVLAPISYLFQWNWEVKYLAPSAISFSSGSLMGLYPVFCLILYGNSSRAEKLVFFLCQLCLIYWWCNRFVKLYRKIYCDKELVSRIYVSDDDAFYFSKRIENEIIEKECNFNQIPPGNYFGLAIIAAFSILPFVSELSAFVGSPFINVFLAILFAPINLMFLGLGTKGILAFYLYPNKMEQLRGRRIFLDMATTGRH